MKVQIKGEGYLVNGNLQVPKDKNNRHYKKILEFIDDGGVVVTEFTDSELLVRAINKKVSEIKQAFDTELNQGFATSRGIKMDATYQAMSFFKDGIEFCEGNGIDVEVRDYDNIDHTKTVSDARAILDEIIKSYHIFRTKKNKLVDLVNSCAKPNEDGTLKEDALEILSKIEWVN